MEMLYGSPMLIGSILLMATSAIVALKGWVHSRRDRDERARRERAIKINEMLNFKH